MTISDTGNRPDVGDGLVPSLTAVFLLLSPYLYIHAAADPTGLPRLLAAHLLAACASLALVRGRGRRPLPVLLWLPVVLWPVLLLAGSIGVSDQPAAWRKILAAITHGQLFLIATQISPRRFPLLVGAALAGALGVTLMGLLQSKGIAFDAYPQAFSPAATFVNRNLAAEYLLALLPLAVALFLSHNRRGANFGFGSALLLGLMLMFFIAAQSRTAWLAALAAPPAVWLLLGRPKLPGPSLDLIPRLLLIALVLLTLWPGKETASLSQTPSLGEEWGSLWQGGAYGDGGLDTVAVRLALWQNSLVALLDHPLTGVGTGQFPAFYPRYHDALVPTPTYGLTTLPEYAHNDLLETVVEMGPTALLLIGIWLWAWVQSLRARRRARSPEQAAFAVGAVALLIAGGAAFPLQMPITSALFALLAGLAIPRDTIQEQRYPRTLVVLCVVINLAVLGLYVHRQHIDLKSQQINRLQQQGRFNEAIRLGEQFRTSTQTDITLLDRLTTLHAARNANRSEALAVADHLLSLRPHHPNGHFRRAFILTTLRREAEAFAALEATDRFAGPNPASHLLRAYLYQRAGDYSSAAKAAAEAQRLDPDARLPRQTLDHLTIPEPIADDPS